MKRALLTALAAGAVSLGATGAVLLHPAAAAAAQQDWVNVVSATAEGGYRIGNPDAPVKLVEYGSMTCDHCADFHRQAMPELKRGPIAGGKVSYEFRNFVLNGPDLAASLIARCGGGPTFFKAADYLFLQQKEWMAPFGSIPAAERERLSKLPQDQMLAGFATAAGLDRRLSGAGISPEKARQCLADKAAIDRLMGIRKNATERYSISGTPTFLINGKVVEAHAWPELKPLLSKPGG